MDKYQNKYRIQSARASWWDYGAVASYFITICTKDRRPFFGIIKNGFMCLNDIGTLVHQEWVNTPILRPDMNIELGAFVVMPNHIHGIITIGGNIYNQNNDRDALQCVSTTPSPETAINKFGPQRKNLSAIVRGIKSTVTKQARLTHSEFGWQPRFHDHIIREEASYHRISRYIYNNPIKWTEDKFFT